MWYCGRLNSTPRLGRITPLSRTKCFLRILCSPLTSISLNISSMCSCCRFALSCNHLTNIAKYFISLVFTVRSSRLNNVDCKVRKELSELNNFMKSRNVNLGDSIEIGCLKESEDEEKDDGDGDEER